jgi:LemA protein
MYPVARYPQVDVSLVFLAFIVALALAWLVGTFNGLVRMRQHVTESWSDIETELKRRYGLIPNLVETVKGYAAHERAVLDRLVEARARAMASTGSPAAQAPDEGALVSALRQLFVLVEGHPQLKAAANFVALQQELANTEDRIAAARRFYNANVRDFNTRLQVFPSNILAGLMRLQPAESFDVEDASVRETPGVDSDPPR